MGLPPVPAFALGAGLPAVGLLGGITPGVVGGEAAPDVPAVAGFVVLASAPATVAPGVVVPLVAASPPHAAIAIASRAES